MKRAFVFPGQGSQAVGMGQALAAAFAPARRVFDEVDEALSQNLSLLMFEGPEGDLTLTENAQPSLMAASLAVIRVLEAEGDFELGRNIAYVAGHSLGEYSALAAAGGVEVGDAARLLRIRGQAMQQAVPVGKGAMAALLGLDVDTGRAIAEEAAQGEVCAVANDNAPGQIVGAIDCYRARSRRTAGDPPPGKRALSFPADGARRSSHGASTRSGDIAFAGGSARCQPLGRGGQRTLGDQARARRPSDRDGAVAGECPVSRGRWCRGNRRDRDGARAHRFDQANRPGSLGAIRRHSRRGSIVARGIVSYGFII
jgi:hypothetical protein